MDLLHSKQKQEHHAACQDGESISPDKRRFRPEDMYDANNINLIECHFKGPDFVLAACPGAREPCEHCGELTAHNDVFIVAIYGSCKGNGTQSTRSSIGVFFRHGSVHNISRIAPPTVDASQKAELVAGISALKTILQIKKQGVALSKVIIKSDSEYLVKRISEWIGEWKKNGWKTSRGTEVSNKSVFEKLEAGVERLNKRGVEVLFWHVPREANEDAHKLAELAHGDSAC